MKKLLLFILLVSSRINSQTYVLIPDVNFRNYLQGIVPTAISGNSLDITNTLVTTTTQTINVYGGPPISNLTGVQYFSSLTYLNCGNNNLNNLPALSNSLTYLNCSGNTLNSLPVLPNSLQTLYCYGNALISLPVLPNSLQTLYCNSNTLSSLPVLPNSLQTLWCYANPLGILPALPNSLTNLNCSINSLTSLPVLPNSLTSLACTNNSLTILPVLPNSLINLGCNDNKIACFPILPAGLVNVFLNNNPFNCLPNYVLPAMYSYTTTPLCVAGNTNGCVVAGIEELNSNNNQINIFPNPTNGQFIIENIGIVKQTIQLFDLNGRLIFIQELYGKTQIDVSALNDGIYNLTIKTSDNTFNKKLIIVR